MGRRSVTNRTMYLYHLTHKNNWYSIGVQGLLAEYAASARTAVWLVNKARIAWAVDHIAARDGFPAGDLMIVRVRVRRSNLRRNKVRGVWYHLGDIYPCRIEKIELYSDWTLNQ